MDWILTFCETRVLGCLLEKEMTTPDYYPLTLNSLMAACNQKSNREPVLSLDEDTVLNTIRDLRDKHLALRVDVAGSRVPKYRHGFTSQFPLEHKELAILTVLFLRGPQTLGEIRTRCERIYAFQDLEEVETALGELTSLKPDALVEILSKQPGQKERRYIHLFAGPADEETDAETQMPFPDQNSAPRADLPDLTAQVSSLKQELAGQRAALDQLREDFENFRKQLE
jgi:hypothetical protein